MELRPRGACYHTRCVRSPARTVASPFKTVLGGAAGGRWPANGPAAKPGAAGACTCTQALAIFTLAAARFASREAGRAVRSDFQKAPLEFHEQPAY